MNNIDGGIVYQHYLSILYLLAHLLFTESYEFNTIMLSRFGVGKLSKRGLFTCPRNHKEQIPKRHTHFLWNCFIVKIKSLFTRRAPGNRLLLGHSTALNCSKFQSPCLQARHFIYFCCLTFVYFFDRDIEFDFTQTTSFHCLIKIHWTKKGQAWVEETQNCHKSNVKFCVSVFMCIKWFVQSHTENTWYSEDLTSGGMASMSV